MWFEIHQYLTDGVVQGPCSPALLAVQELLNLCYGLFGQFDICVVEAIRGVTGLSNQGEVYLNGNASFFSVACKIAPGPFHNSKIQNSV